MSKLLDKIKKRLDNYSGENEDDNVRLALAETRIKQLEKQYAEDINQLQHELLDKDHQITEVKERARKLETELRVVRKASGSGDAMETT